jgi:hypothetical protein
MKFLHNSLNSSYFFTCVNWVNYWYVQIPWEFCVCLAQERRLAFLVSIYECVLNMPSRREKTVYIIPGVTPSRRTLHPTALTNKLAFQCRCARVSQKLNSLILFPVKITISCYAMTRVWTSLMTLWEVREWYPNVPALFTCLYFISSDVSSCITEPLLTQFLCVLEQSFPALGIFILFEATAQLGPKPPRVWGFEITHRHTALSRTPLDDGSALRRELYLTTHNIQKIDIHAPSGFEPAIPASKRPYTYALDRATTLIGSPSSMRNPIFGLIISQTCDSFTSSHYFINY